MAKDTFTSYIDIDSHGKGSIKHIIELNEFIYKYPNKRFYVTVKRKRTNESNRYYWMCMTIIGKELGYSKEEVNEIMLTHFCSEEFFNERTGSVFKSHPSLSQLSNSEQAELTNNVIRLAASEFNIILPDPSEQIKAF